MPQGIDILVLIRYNILDENGRRSNMNKAELIRKAESGEGLTAKEVLAYQKLVKPVEHTYGKYGTLAKIYLAEHNSAKEWSLGGNLPEYLHNIDKQADEMYESMYAELSNRAEYKHTDNFIENLRKETEIKNAIEQRILTELVYAD